MARRRSTVNDDNADNAVPNDDNAVPNEDNVMPDVDIRQRCATVQSMMIMLLLCVDARTRTHHHC
jgi:hypothetical protein